ncbi:SKP1 component: dimerization-like protein [Dinothrombium tinctorium]|uniref:SKP1 component: dimerization-like protein n=1 Tax=Dinothrombium tinctorium TaxID=1965070 RepID=A0A3S3S8L5_9ACAR|nr:SKP1 component: dimerization-like protein [Dinothrombium tinctorium]RWS08278.1 SKP1 component: dimerization-like protein [Dinothrombium tinctorium]RWS11999.1 SKP1 component: dimerization-like protein [Dinothrombium tinctorium]
MSAIKFETSDGFTIQVERETAVVSKVVKNFLEYHPTDKCTFHLNCVDNATLRKVVEWMRHHKDDAYIETESDESDEERSQDVSIEMDPWDANFLNEDLFFLLDILNAANFMKIKVLFKNCCKKIYLMSKGKSSVEIKRLLKERCDFTDEDLQRIANKYEWMARVN